MKKARVLDHGELADSSNHTRILAQGRPDEVYNLGAQSHVAVRFYQACASELQEQHDHAY